MAIWVFGYGSLISKAGFNYDERLVGFIKDYRRVFYQGSTDHRGTPEFPGRTVTLEPADGEICWGAAYKITKKEDQEIALTNNKTLTVLLHWLRLFLLVLVESLTVDTIIAEVITSAEFHPTHCNTLAYSSSKGSIRLVDLRQSALCDSHAKLFEEQEAPGSRSFFTEIIASISDIKFAKDGRYILSRDYMTLKLWDINMDSGPVATYRVHEHLRPRLCDLYENDSIFDKFECCLSGDGSRVSTGSYSNLFRVFGCAPGSTEATTLEASKNPMRRQVPTPSRPSRSIGNSITRVVRRGAENTSVDANGNSFDFTTKLLHLAWHPSENSIACAAANSLYMYYA